MTKKVIIFLTGSKSSLPIISTAKNSGFRTVLIDADEECHCKEHAEDFHRIAVNECDAIYKIINKYYKEDLAGITAFTSNLIALKTESILCDKFNLPKSSLDSLKLTYDKKLLHKKMEESGCPIPKSIDNISPEAVSEVNTFPVVLKHRKGIGSLGTKIINSKEELLSALKNINTIDYVIQEFIEGELFNISGIIQNKNIYFFSLLKKEVININSIPLTKSFELANQDISSKQIFNELLLSIERFIQINGMDKNFFGADFIFDSKQEKFYLLEIGYRLDLKLDRLYFLSGFNLYDLQIQLAIGKKVEIPRIKESALKTIQFMYPSGTKAINRIQDEKIFIEWEDKKEIQISPSSVSDILGWIVYDKDKFHDLANKILCNIPAQ